ncbi:hypothetical protein H0H92_012460 [Tricholoma furcatifolium]|nr:hypothetical protein H0H92_012460 [Tricholoma furcatifolium]
MSSSRLLIPLTFQKENSHFLEESFSRSHVSLLKSWSEASGSEGDVDGGCAIGTDDGSLFLFHRIRQVSLLPPQSLPETRSHTRSSTPTSPLPFNIHRRSRVVSGITAEQVEAPKNYVDFDEEPDRLKDILQGRQPKEFRDKPPTPVEISRPPTRSPTPSLVGVPSSKRIAIPKSLLSTTTSAPSSSHPPSPLEPVHESRDTLELWCHATFPHSGVGGAVASVQVIDGTRLMLVLQASGRLNVISLDDGSCVAATEESVSLKPPTGIENQDHIQALWVWDRLTVYNVGESTIIVTLATIDPNSPLPTSHVTSSNNSSDKSRLSIFEIHSNDLYSPLDVVLEKIGQWYFDEPSYGVWLHQEPDDTLKILNLSADGHVLSRGIRILPRVSQLESPPAENAMNLNIPNPFKSLKPPRSTDHLHSPANDHSRPPGRIACDDAHDLGELLATGEPVLGFQARLAGKRTRAVVWSSEHLTDRAESYSLNIVDADDNEVDIDEVTDEVKIVVEPLLLQTVSLPKYDAIDITSALEVTITSTADQVRNVVSMRLDVGAKGPLSRITWPASSSIRPTKSPAEVTCLLPLQPDLIVQGCADGKLRQSSLIQLIGDTDSRTATAEEAPSPRDAVLNGHVAGLHVVSNGRTKERFIVGGADDGSVAFWTFDHYKLCARWTLFITPLSYVVQIPDTEKSPLKGCALCISADGTIAVIVIDGFQFLYMVPGSSAPLRRICIGANNLLLVYEDNRARLWDTQTHEFWRSMAQEKVDELLKQGGWMDITLDAKAGQQAGALMQIPNWVLPDIASTLLLDLERFTTESLTVAKSISTNRDQTRAILQTLERLRAVLSVLLTPGLNSDIDAICSQKLGIRPTQATVGFSRNGVTTLYRKSHSKETWCLSGDVSAARALSIAVMLNALSVFEEFMEAANTVMIFYATSLSLAVGPKYQGPSLVYLARRWFDGSGEVRQSTRVLFDYAIACLSDQESEETAEHWQHHLPCLQPTADRESMQAALALFLCGYLAAEKYSLLSVNALIDISKSIALYLHDEQSLHRVLAVDLCSRGFHIWQHYIDAMEILRALFTLATSSRKDSISLQNVGSQARLAVLQIASTDTPLFMTTLGLDILTPPTLEHRKAVMQIVAFLIRKRPLVLQPNIPKLMEAVVRSLDPNATTHREAVLDSATEIIGYVVRTFPAVDFHMGNQRLVVGSTDGAAVMYDLKTAIRLYVLEGHKKAISACSFSPDGRRLLTLSIEESVALVWKVGSSFASFFNPGAPPRQGHGDSKPFKTISFNVGEAATLTLLTTLQAIMSPQEMMDLIRITWVADRSVQIKIRESILTFSA